MKILGLDTTMTACSVALVDTEQSIPLASRFVTMDRGHAEALAPMIAAVMEEAGTTFDAVDRIAVTTGPGTFTGIRIGLAMARGLGLACGIPLVGIDTLTAIAANAPADMPVLVVTDARNQEVYAAQFDRLHRSTTAPHLTTAAVAAEGLTPFAAVAGTAAAAVIAESGRSDLTHLLVPAVPDAANFARLASGLLAEDIPQPLYLRAPDAKPQAVMPSAGLIVLEAVDAAAAPLLAAIHAEAFPDSWTAESFQRLLAMPGTSAIIAHVQGEPAGFVLARTAADEAEIITVATRPPSRRRGVARALIARQIGELGGQGVRQIFLEVSEVNQPARELYASLGFGEAGRRRGYYRPAGRQPEDAVVLRRELQP